MLELILGSIDILNTTNLHLHHSLIIIKHVSLHLSLALLLIILSHKTSLSQLSRIGTILKLFTVALLQKLVPVVLIRLHPSLDLPIHVAIIGLSGLQQALDQSLGTSGLGVHTLPGVRLYIGTALSDFI